jgi:hypothetical protein
VYSGADLYSLMRFGPVLFGALGIAGLALLLFRWDGALAAFAGALAVATMPEVIARTDMMTPTALDLAILPFLFLAMLEMLRGKLGWALPALLMTSFLIVAHPWVLAIVDLAGFGFLVLYLAFPWRAARGPPLTREGVAAAIAILGGGFGVAIATRWQASGTGFGELALPVFGTAGNLGLVAVGMAALLAVALFFLPYMVRTRLPALNKRRNGTLVQAVGVVALAAIVVELTMPAVQHGMPAFVDLPRMIGWPLLALAVLGLLMVPFAGSPALLTGAGLFLTAYPFTIYNPLNSDFWPARTAVFLGVGAAILAGGAVARLAEAAGLPAWVARTWRARRGAAARPTPRAGRTTALVATAMAVGVPALLVGSAYAGAVLATEPAPYPGGWYRYFNQCEFDGLRHVADLLNQDPKAVGIADSWEAELVIAAFTDNSGRVWYKQDLFQPGFDHGNFAALRQRAVGGTYVVVDRYLTENVGSASDGFLHQAPWTLIDQRCPGQGELQNRLAVYQLGG